jgi:CPA2 family monovalent cation:H+ antiporter-2
MYSIGMEFSLRDLLEVKWVALLGGPLGILMSVGLGLGAGTLLGWSPMQGVIVGMVISVASTMVLARLLMDRGELRSQHGRVMIGLKLVEDLAVVVLTILIPVLGTKEPVRFVALGAALGKAALILVPFALLAATVLPRVMSIVARMRSDEMLVLVALAIGLGTAALTQALGLTQIGEFSFILVQAARSAGHIGADVYSATLAAALLSILLNAALVRYIPSRLGI